MNINSTLGGGSLASRVEEERSQLGVDMCPVGQDTWRTTIRTHSAVHGFSISDHARSRVGWFHWTSPGRLGEGCVRDRDSEGGGTGEGREAVPTNWIRLWKHGNTLCVPTLLKPNGTKPTCPVCGRGWCRSSSVEEEISLTRAKSRKGFVPAPRGANLAT